MTKKAIALIAMLAALALVAAACGDSSGDAGGEGGDGGDFKTVRFVFAPDPVWNYLNASGIREQMEQEANIVILDTATWNEVPVYAGGHADIVSVGDFEVPTLEQEFGIDSVIFGKYNIDRSIAVTSNDNADYETLADCKDGVTAVWDPLSSTTIWGVLVNEMHGLDFRVGGGDFETIVVDHTNTADQVVNGSADCALVLPDFAVPILMENQVKILYDGKTSANLYADLVGKPGHEGPMINIFLARADWYEDHPEEAAFFLELWEVGVQAWAADRDQFVDDYRGDFAVETPEQIAWMQDYLADHDWFVKSVYLDQGWIDSEEELFGFLENAGLSDTSDPPTYSIITP